VAENKKPWGGRFADETDALAQAFNASLAFDRRLWREDLAGSRAHVRMLAEQGILPPDEAEKILAGLNEIEREIEEGRFPWREAYEDVHMNIEARLVELVGEVGKKLHTARSRNDQVATDLRLWTKGALTETEAAVHELQGALLAAAEEHLYKETILPGYTHLQRAQPILLAHWFLAYFWMLERDRGRLRDARARLDASPLGAAALAGTSFPIDRFQTTRELGFARPVPNSLDAVASRDFALEVLAALAILQTTLSRLAEELVLYSSFEFGFVELPDAFATGSSIMPQKKNPDIPELIRAKAGRVLGDLVGLFAVVKGLPLAYNKDLQEDKEPLFDAFDQVLPSLKLLARLIPGLNWRPEVMARAAAGGFSLATDLADYLAKKGVPFREAHRVVGSLVRRLAEEGRDLESLTSEELRAAHPAFAADALKLLNLKGAVASRTSYGGTAPEAVRRQLEEAKTAWTSG